MLVRVLYTRPDASPRLPFQGRWILRSEIQRGSRIRGLRQHRPRHGHAALRMSFARICGLCPAAADALSTIQQKSEIRTYSRAASAKPNSFSKQFDFAFS